MDEPDFRRLVILAASALAGRRAVRVLGDDVAEAIERSAALLGRGTAATRMDEMLSEALAAVWEGGWQPSEAVRQVRRRLTQSHSDLVATATLVWQEARAEEFGRPPPEWMVQLDEMGAADCGRWGGADWLAPWARRAGLSWSDVLMQAVEALGVLMRLPKTEVLLPPPSRWKEYTFGLRHEGAVDESVLAKVRALLSKAESTNFEHEAEALTAKAQELISRYAIDEALAQDPAGQQRVRPVARRLAVDDPYSSAKSGLLAVVAGANGVRTVWDDRFGLMTIIGFESDLDAVEVLFTSLLMQASRAMLSNGRVTDGRGRSRTRSFRQSFLVAFSGRIRERLFLASMEVARSASEELGRDVLPVLADRRDEVDEATKDMFPHLRRKRGPSISNESGWRAGRAAAETATLGPERGRLGREAG